uniref:ferric reductase-like transmembrane domain-containing protein n=1 Tax=Leisingera sp. ANG-M1 TaxID=1577895 RepID=UPI00315A30EE
MSPLLAWRHTVYIAAGFAGVIAMALLLVQPLLAGGYLPGLSVRRGRNVHRWTGGALIAAVATHVAGLWITSPPDVADALLFASPTPFSAWGVIAMWAVFGAALLAAFRGRFRQRLRSWRRAHTALVSVTVIGSVAHAMMIEGTMETVSKTLLCVFTLAATGKAVADFRAWATRSHRDP